MAQNEAIFGLFPIAITIRQWYSRGLRREKGWANSENHLNQPAFYTRDYKIGKVQICIHK